MDSQAWDRRYSGSEFEWTTRPNQFVVRELAALTPGRALDLAAGEGRNAVWLAERDWRVTAVDFSAVGLEKGRRLSSERGVNVEWVHADLDDYQPAPDAFDVVLITYLHLPATRRARILSRAAAALAPAGTLLVVGHDLSNLTEGIGGPRDPALLYTPETIVSEMSSLRVERAERVHRSVPGDESGRVAIDTLVRATRRP